MKNKIYGILVALLPFISGTYKNLANWSTSETVGYNIFSLVLIFLGIYLIVKPNKQPLASKKYSFDDLISSDAQKIIQLLENKIDRRKSCGDVDTSTLELVNELKVTLSLFTDVRAAIKYDPTKLDLLVQDLVKYLETISSLNTQNDVLWIGGDSGDVDTAIVETKRLQETKKQIEDRLKHMLKK